MLAASMVVVGDEILGGYVPDTNSQLVARRLQEHGVELSCVHVVADDLGAIDEALSAELERVRPRLVLTSGGIGSTPDDLTYEAVAASLGRELVEDPTIGARIEEALEWSREQGLEVTDAFAWHLGRMARIPAGSRLLERDGGWSPGVAVDIDGGIDHGGATVVVLPGVPTEFEALLDHAVVPRLVAGRNPRPHVRELTHTYPESALNLAFAEVLERFPAVKLGSYPGRPMLVRLRGPHAAVEEATARIAAAIAALDASDAGRRMAAARAARAAAREASEAAEADDTGRDGPTEEDA